MGDAWRVWHAIVHPLQPLAADGAFRRCNPRLVDEVFGRHSSAACQAVARGYQHIGDVICQHDGLHVLGDGQRRCAPTVHQADLAVTGGNQIDCVPWLVFGEADLQVGIRRQQSG